jgi:hypothetical protein
MRNLRNRFTGYANKKPPTGDPDCPPLVRRAKQITEAIKQKAGMKIMQDRNVGGQAVEAPVVASKRNGNDVVATKKTRFQGNSNSDRFLEAYLASEKMQASKLSEMPRKRRCVITRDKRP